MWTTLCRLTRALARRCLDFVTFALGAMPGCLVPLRRGATGHVPSTVAAVFADVFASIWLPPVARIDYRFDSRRSELISRKL